VLLLLATSPGKCSSSCFVLSCSALGIGLASLAETFTGGPEGSLVDLTVAFDDVDGVTVLVLEGSNTLVSSIPAHLGAALLECFNEGDGLIGSHVETFGE
jgi:hypothetical protein